MPTLPDSNFSIASLLPALMRPSSWAMVFRPSENLCWSLVSTASTLVLSSAYSLDEALSSFIAACCVFSPSSTGGAPTSSTALPSALYASDICWKATESVRWTSAGGLWSSVFWPMAALALLIFWSCGWAWAQNFLAQSLTLSSLSSLQPDSVSTSTAPPDSAAANFLFTGLVPSKALGPELTRRGFGSRVPVNRSAPF